MAGVGNLSGAGGELNAGGDGGVTGTGGATSELPGPCDIYRDAGQPCVAAYSTVRRLLSTYAGPLYQVRSGSSEQNTGSGGETHDISQTPDGFADAALVDAACAGSICTISLLYDQSGNGSDLPVAKAGIQFGGPYAAMDDFESSATKESLLLGGHSVYPLYMEARQGYRLARQGAGMPRSNEPQGIYMLANGTHAGVGCCWEFGNAPPDALTFYGSTTLFYGSGVTTVGTGEGPWFMADFHMSIWAGGSQAAVPAPPDPSLNVKFALGFLKTDPGIWALRVADVTTASALTTAYQGAVPKPFHNDGGVILGVNSDNSNASWGTFYEGAIVAGMPDDATELAVLQNVQGAGYGSPKN
jgi:non-reducing end alpha-L-arabinofuranosidase